MLRRSYSFITMFLVTADITADSFVVTLEKLIEKHGNTSGFDYLRLVLAVAVLCVHSFSTSYGRVGEAIPFAFPQRPLALAVLPMFFALSGFLVAGSYFRTQSLKSFIALRILRIVPALSVEVFLCAIVLGSIFTTLPLLEYFTHPLFLSYFGNTIGWIHFHLPGVFESNPTSGIVNISLWTVPFELECYLALIIFILIGALRSRQLFAGLLLALHIVLFARWLMFGNPIPIDSALPPRLLVLSFLYGVLIFLYRDRIQINLTLAVIAGLAMVATLSFGTSANFAPPFIAYLTVAIGMMNPPRTPLIMSGDYSYGIYLYAYPMQQTYVSLASNPQWYWNILIALPLTALFAAFSWHCIEKHVLKLKRLVKTTPRREALANPELVGSAAERS